MSATVSIHDIPNPWDKLTPAEKQAIWDREAQDEASIVSGIVADIGEVAWRRRCETFDSIHAPDFADYSREHRAPEGRF